MEKNAKKAILKHRARLLSLDYFDLSAPLLAAEVLPAKKHKDIKTEANTDKARVDLLLEWIDESAPKGTFEVFLQAVRNCKELILAKKIKREAAGILPKPKAPSTPNKAGTPVSAVVKAEPNQKTSKPKKPTTPKVNGLPGSSPVQNAVPTSTTPGPVKQEKKAKPGVKTPKAKNTPKPTDLSASKAIVSSIKPPPSGTPKAKKPSAAADANQPAKKTPLKRKSTEISTATETKPKLTKSLVAKKMTFAQVETKQKDFRQKFKFLNSDVVSKNIIFKDKTDILYLGCPTMASNEMCCKKVELRSKEFVCEDKHRNNSFKKIPHLTVVCTDGTADLPLTFFKKDVEKFSGMNTSDLELLSVDDIKTKLDKVTGSKFSVEVQCEKAKKKSKAAANKWNNVATITDGGDQGPPAKKKRKN